MISILAANINMSGSEMVESFNHEKVKNFWTSKYFLRANELFAILTSVSLILKKKINKGKQSYWLKEVLKHLTQRFPNFFFSRRPLKT